MMLCFNPVNFNPHDVPNPERLSPVHDRQRSAHRPLIRLAGLFAVLFFALVSANALAAGSAAHVVVVVWDGMRPDFVSEQTTPALCRLMREGVTFGNHHAVFISSTEVNGAVLATGVYPSQSGIIGNHEYRPALSGKEPIMTGDLAAVRQGDRRTGNHFVQVATLAEMLHCQGLGTAIAGAKSVTLLHDRRAGMEDELGTDLFEGHVLPRSFARKVKGALGRFPAASVPKRDRDRWTTQALIDPLWDKGMPAFSLLWLSEPDYSQHLTGPGSKVSLEAIKSSDENLDRVLGALERRGLREQSDVIVLSDHGFSTIARQVDIAKVLAENGFPAARGFSTGEADRRNILVVSNGGTVFLYVLGHDQRLIEQIVHWLQGQPFCGVVFTRPAVEGAFTLDQVKLDSADAPDIILSLRWSSDPSLNGTPGLVCSDGGELGPGQGMHASLSRFDMHNLCVAAGPDFRKGFRDELPTGNIDIVPTILWLLGAKAERELSGRVLTEALAQAGDARPPFEIRELEATWRSEDYSWHQYLKYSQVRGVCYFDEGNGEEVRTGDAAGN